MKLITPALAFAIAAVSFTPVSALSEVPPPGLFGEFQAKKKICFPGPKGDWSECEDAIDFLTFTRKAGDSVRNIGVKAEFIFTNGHTCTFEGDGVWNSVDRVIAADQESGCELVLIYSPPKVHTVVTTEEQCKTLCGMRGNLDGVVLRKAK